MEKVYTTLQLIQGMVDGTIKDGTIFVNNLSEKAIVKGNAVHWIVGDNYVSSVIGVTTDLMTAVWKESTEDNMENVEIGKALELLADGETVSFLGKSGTMHRVSTLEELTAVLKDAEKNETVQNLYYGKALVPVNRLKQGVTVDVDKINLDGLVTVLGTPDEETTNGRQGLKLTDKQVYSIHFRRHMLADNVAALADDFGITNRMVYYILDGTYWPDVYKDFHSDYSIYGY